jgi:hypothetical protein
MELGFGSFLINLSKALSEKVSSLSLRWEKARVRVYKTKS